VPSSSPPPGEEVRRANNCITPGASWIESGAPGNVHVKTPAVSRVVVGSSEMGILLVR
jgi:hypothetical protein